MTIAPLGPQEAYYSTSLIDGWLSRHEGVLLWQLARTGGGKGSIVEVGSWKGKSTVWLAYGSKSAGREKVVAVDLHTGSKEHRETFGTVQTYREFIRNIRASGVDDWVIPIVGSSRGVANSWKGDIRLVFIDGSHEYLDVRDDFSLWFEHLGLGGLMAMHDSYFAGGGPMKVLEQIILRHPQVTHVGFVGSITFFQKGKQSVLQRMRNYALLICLRAFRTCAGLGRPPVKFWLSLLTSTTDRSARTIFWVYWQAFFSLKRAKIAV